MARRYDRKGYQRSMGKCTGTRKYSNGRVGKCNHPSHACFSGDSLVLTPTGYVRIDSLLPGSRIVTQDVSDGSSRVSKVKRLICNRAVVLEVTFRDSDRRLKVSASHSLRTADNHWITADKLRVGTRVAGVNGPQEIMSVHRGVELHPVYNLIPYGHKTFVVQNLIVHSFTYFRRVREQWHRATESLLRLIRLLSSHDSSDRILGASST